MYFTAQIIVESAAFDESCTNKLLYEQGGKQYESPLFVDPIEYSYLFYSKLDKRHKSLFLIKTEINIQLKELRKYLYFEIQNLFEIESNGGVPFLKGQ